MNIISPESNKRFNEENLYPEDIANKDEECLYSNPYEQENQYMRTNLQNQGNSREYEETNNKISYKTEINSLLSSSDIKSSSKHQRQSFMESSSKKGINKRMCCNCKKSFCLKLYCECFANKTYCMGCNCINCLNTEDNNFQRDKAMQATLDRNPSAFDPKIVQESAEVI